LIPSGDHADLHLDGRASAALVLSFVFVVIAIAVGTGLTAASDTWIGQRMELRRGIEREVADAVIQGGNLTIAGLAAVAGLVLAGIRRRYSWLILLAPLATLPIELLAKNVVPRTMFRNATDLQVGPFLTIYAPYTFPSGNAARVAALVFALLLHPARARVATFGTKAGTAAAVLAAAALSVCAWGHLATGDHWASDVVGGLILGAAAAFALGWITERHELATAGRPSGRRRRGG
jgi:membrane-associated phospholipid phosphatase